MFSRIERKEAFTVVGTEVTAPCEVPSPEIGPIVCKYFQNKAGVKNAVSNLNYGVVWKQDEEEFTYVFGQEVSKAEDIPECMVVREFEAFDYAVITFKGAIKDLGQAFKYFFGTWLPSSGYEYVKRPFFEVYGEKFMGPENETSEMEIYYPIKKIEGGEKTQENAEKI